MGSTQVCPLSNPDMKLIKSDQAIFVGNTTAILETTGDIPTDGQLDQMINVSQISVPMAGQ